MATRAVWYLLLLLHANFGLSMDIVSNDPTLEPTMEPTADNDQDLTISMKWDQPLFGDYPISRELNISDPFGRIQLSININVNNPNVIDSNKFNIDCRGCFIWQFRAISNHNNTLNTQQQIEWINLNNDWIFGAQRLISNYYVNDKQIASSLIIKSIRTEHNGYCYKNKTSINHILIPGKSYQFRLKITANNMEFISTVATLHIDQSPEIDQYQVKDLDSLKILDPFSIETLSSTDDEYTYNVLFSNVLMSNEFLSDLSMIKGIVPNGDYINDNDPIIILTKNKNGFIECSAINVTFPSLAENGDGVNLTKFDRIIAKPIPYHVSISLYSIIIDLPQSATRRRSLSNEDIKSHYIYSIISNLITNSPFDGSNTYISSDILTTEITTLSTLISNISHFNTNNLTSIETLLIDEYLPIIINVINIYIDDNNDISFQPNIQSIITVTQKFITNLIKILISQSIESTEIRYQYLIDTSMELASISLTLSIPGESFTFLVETHSVSSKKFQTANYLSNSTITPTQTQPSCGTKRQSLTIPQSVIDRDINSDTFNCVFLSTSTPSSNIQNILSDLISLSLYDNDSTNVILNTYKCDAYMVSISITDGQYIDENQYLDYELDNEYLFPDCPVLTGESECIIYNQTGETVTCACESLPVSIQLTTGLFTPVSTLNLVWSWTELNVNNIINIDSCLIMGITALSIVFLGIVFMVILPCFNRYKHIEDETMIATNDVVFQSVYDKKIVPDLLWEKMQAIETNLPNPKSLGQGFYKLTKTPTDERAMVYIHYRLFMSNLRNYHILLPIFCIRRNNGTNYSLSQRVGCLLVYILSIMILTAFVYYLQTPLDIKDIDISFIISFIGIIPSFIFKQFFIKSKPMIHESNKDIKSITEDMLKQVINRQPYHQAKESTDSNASSIAPATLDMVESNSVQPFNQDTHDIIEKQQELFIELRNDLFGNIYPFPNKCRLVSWLLMIIFIMGCCFGIIYFGLQFEMEYDTKLNQQNSNLQNGLYDNECWENDLRLRIETALTEDLVENKQDSLYTAYDRGNYHNNNKLQKWIISVITSFLIFIFLYQPFIIYVGTWVKLLMFTYNLKMEISIRNLILYIRKCCGGYEKCRCCQIKRSNQTDKDVYVYQKLKKIRLNNKLNNNPKQKSSFLADRNRPFDLLSFISNKDLFINDSIVVNDDIGDIPGPNNVSKQLSLIDESKEKRYEGDRNETTTGKDEYKEEEQKVEEIQDDDIIPKHAAIKTQELDEMVIEMQDILQYTKTDDVESDEE